MASLKAYCLAFMMLLADGFHGDRSEKVALQ